MPRPPPDHPEGPPGPPAPPSAADLAVNPRTVPRWLNADLEGGLDGRRPRNAPGRPPKVPARLAAAVRRWVIEGPVKPGRDRANGTHAELADHRFKAHGVSASRSAVSRFGRKQGIRPYRPTYRDLGGDPVEQAEAAEDLSGLKKKRRPANGCC